MIAANSSLRRPRLAIRARSAGSRFRSHSMATAMCIAVGKVSLLDWLRLT